MDAFLTEFKDILDRLTVAVSSLTFWPLSLLNANGSCLPQTHAALGLAPASFYTRFCEEMEDIGYMYLYGL